MIQSGSRDESDNDVTAAIGRWVQTTAPPWFGGRELAAVAERCREAAVIVRDPRSGRLGAGLGGRPARGPEPNGFELVASLPPLYPEWLGDRGFLQAHGVRFPYVAGAMANGIATVELVTAMARANMLGFYGAAGLSYDQVERAIDDIQCTLEHHPGRWGANLIHSPAEPELEKQVAELYIRRGVARVSASAYITLTPAIVRYACSGLTRDPNGSIRRPHSVFAKVSHPDVARRFMRPAPADLVAPLVARGALTPEEARLAAELPLAEDVTAEADSGGHTDNRPLVVLLPEIMRARDQVMAEQRYQRAIRVGAAGGLGTPTAVAGAFALGADYVLTGSVNQAAVESGLSAAGKAMLATADTADVTMAPAADMFELGINLQVLKRGTMFAQRARKLWELYSSYDSLDALPAVVRDHLERAILGASIDRVWSETQRFWSPRDPNQLVRAERDPRHRMALVFRWYLGSSSRWAIAGEPTRKHDYQIWCGPAMGAFNAWTRGSFLANPSQRSVVQIAFNLLEGAAVLTRALQLRHAGVDLPAEVVQFSPRPLG